MNSNQKQLRIGVLAACLVLSAGVWADTMTKDQYRAREKDIATQYKADKARCDSLAGNAKDVCVEEAKGQKKIAEAELDAAYKPSIKNRYEAQVAHADAVYAVAKERCDDKAGNDKDVCVKAAKDVHVHAIADAKAARETAEANADAGEKSTEARKDAAEDKRDADYALAKEKCDVLAGNAKDNCLNDAKARYGRR